MVISSFVTAAPQGSRDLQRPPLLFLVNPRLKYSHFMAQKELCRLMGKRGFSVPLALPLLAALTPRRYEVRIVDEEMDPLPSDAVPDIVGITTLVSTIGRGAEIARLYRAMGSTVVMGGSYATYRAEECLGYADSVVLGEAEGLWEELLADWEAGRLKRVYRADRVPDYRRSPPPRWDLVRTDDIMVLSVQVSRGCPYSCDFCLVTKMFGNRIRCRDIDDVVAEIRALPVKKLFFVDDNLTARKPYARRLMEALRPLGVSWACQASIDVASDATLLAAMADAGCVQMVIGFESLDPASLREMRKRHNRVERFEGAIRAIHSHGIHVNASFVVGFDADTLEAYDRIYEFGQRCSTPFVMLSPLTPAPGTDLWDRMEAEGRLLGLDGDYVNGMFPSMRYRNMSLVAMFDKHFETLRKLYAFENIHGRATGLFATGGFTRPERGGVGLGEKVDASLRVLRRFLLTADPWKRRLFLDLFALGRGGKVSMDKVAVFLLTASGIEEYFKSAGDWLGGVREKLARIDTGPWRPSG